MIKKIIIYLVSSLLLGVLLIYFWIPSSKEIKSCQKTKMFQVDLCPGSENYVPLNQISKNLQNAILLTEDGNFYHHNGFDQEGIEHCFQKMKQKKKIVCGGSTISQQLAKNMYLSKDKSFFRKALEALITIQIEKSLTKKEIFERYLNVVQFGKNIFGIKEAAYFYFKKSPSNLNITEAAFLAMVLPNPEKYSQSYYRKDLTQFARRRLNKIIQDMSQYKKISSDDYVNALDNLDFFLSAGQKNVIPKEQSEDLSDEEMIEMNTEENFSE